MKLAKNLFQCVVVVNMVAYFAFVVVMLVFSPSRAVFHRCRAVMLASMLLLLVFSIASLFFDRRAAGRGFLVFLVGFLIMQLFPEL
jgi:hypothetical protein